MKIIHLKVNSEVHDHVMWLLKQFDPNDVEIVSDEFVKNKAELDEALREIDAGEATFYTLEEVEQMTDEVLNKIEKKSK